ncbi:MAG: hypothetical protein H6807_07875 [Planctomycetes bacterium]|nr:hypothetical protein [Planctomycetota bacterium]
MESMIDVGLALLLIPVAGAVLLRLADFRRQDLGLAWLPISWSLGTLPVYLLLFVCGHLGRLSAARGLFLPLLVLGFLVAVYSRRSAFVPRAAATGQGRPFWLLLPAALLVTCWWQQADLPYAGDELAIWGGRALCALEADDLGPGYHERVSAAIARGEQAHADYPLLNTLLQAWAMMSGKAELGAATRLPIQLFDLAALLLLAAIAVERCRPVFLRFLVVVMPFMTFWYAAPQAMSDRIVAFAALLAVDGLVPAPGRSARAAALRVWLGLALLVATKNEGAMLAGIIVLAALPAVWRREGKRGIARFGRLLVPAASIFIGHWTWAWQLGFENDLVPMSGGGQGLVAVLFSARSLDRVPALGGLVLRDLVLDPFAGAFLPLVLLGAILLCWRRLAAAWLPLLVAALGLAAFLLVFLATPYDLKWHWSTAGPRVVSQLDLILALALLLLLGDGTVAGDVEAGEISPGRG